MEPNSPSRRQALALLAAGGAAAALPVPVQGQTPAAATQLTCIIRYQIDPFQKEAFRHYAATWGRIIPRCGGYLVGYFLPAVGTNDVAWGLIAFDSLAAYETYQQRLRADPEALANFAAAQQQRFILREERNFVETVAGTLSQPPSRG